MTTSGAMHVHGYCVGEVLLCQALLCVAHLTCCPVCWTVCRCGCIIGKDYPFPIIDHTAISKVNMGRMKVGQQALLLACLSVCLRACLFACPSACLPICRAICQSAHSPPLPA
jgi:hypothetical protein